MNYLEILDKIVVALSSTEIAAFCQDEYGADPTILVGLDQENPPRSTQYPILAVSGLTKSWGYSKQTESYMFSVFVGVYDETTTTNSNVTTMTGLQNEHELRALVEKSLFNSFPASCVSNTETFFDVVFPFFCSIISFEVSMPRNTRVPQGKRN